MIRVQNFLLIIVIILLASCASQRPKPPALTNPFYWQLNYQGRTYHVLGTMHVGYGLRDLPQSVVEDFLNAELAAFEVTRKTQKELGTGLLEKLLKSVRSDQKKLETSLSSRAWKNLSFTMSHPEAKPFSKTSGWCHRIPGCTPV